MDQKGLHPKGLRPDDVPPDDTRQDSLRPATTEEIADALAFALRYDGRKRVAHADEMMARITADRLVRHLRGAGFVLMRGPAGMAPSTSRHGEQ